MTSEEMRERAIKKTPPKEGKTIFESEIVGALWHIAAELAEIRETNLNVEVRGHVDTVTHGCGPGGAHL